MKDDKDQFVYEALASALERTIKRLWILCILLVILLVGSNVAWLYYESQFEDKVTTVTQDVDAESDGNSDINLNTVGGDLIDGWESESATDQNH